MLSRVRTSGDCFDLWVNAKGVRQVWSASKDSAPFGAFLRLLQVCGGLNLWHRLRCLCHIQGTGNSSLRTLQIFFRRQVPVCLRLPTSTCDWQVLSYIRVGISMVWFHSNLLCEALIVQSRTLCTTFFFLIFKLCIVLGSHLELFEKMDPDISDLEHRFTYALTISTLCARAMQWYGMVLL